MEPPWTEPADVTARWVGEDKPTDTGLITTLIGDAERVLLREYPDIGDRIVGDPLPDPLPEDPLTVATVKQVVARMVIRHLRNPDATRQTTETEGPFSRNRTFAGDQPGEMILTDDERRLLGYSSSDPTQKAFSVAAGDPGPVFLGGPRSW